MQTRARHPQQHCMCKEKSVPVAKEFVYELRYFILICGLMDAKINEIMGF